MIYKKLKKLKLVIYSCKQPFACFRAIRERERRTCIARKKQQNKFDNGAMNGEVPNVKVVKPNIADTFCVEQGVRKENNSIHSGGKYKTTDIDRDDELPPDGDSERLIRKRLSDGIPDGADKDEEFKEEVVKTDEANPAFYPADTWRMDPALEEKRTASVANLQEEATEEDEPKKEKRNKGNRSRINSKENMQDENQDENVNENAVMKSPREDWQEFDDKNESNKGLNIKPKRPTSAKKVGHLSKRAASNNNAANQEEELSPQIGPLPPLGQSKYTPKAGSLPPIGGCKMPGADMSIESLALQSLDNVIEAECKDIEEKDLKLQKDRENENRHKYRKQRSTEDGEVGEIEKEKERRHRHRRHRHKEGEEGDGHMRHRRHRRHKHKDEEEMTEEEKEKRRRHRKHHHHHRRHRHDKNNTVEAKDGDENDLEKTQDLESTQDFEKVLEVYNNGDTSEWDSSQSSEGEDNEEEDIDITKSIGALSVDDKPVTRLKEQKTPSPKKHAKTETLLLETLTEDTLNSTKNPKYKISLPNRSGSYDGAVEQSTESLDLRERRSSAGNITKVKRAKKTKHEVSESQNSLGMDSYGVFDIDNLGATEEIEV